MNTEEKRSFAKLPNKIPPVFQKLWTARPINTGKKPVENNSKLSEIIGTNFYFYWKTDNCLCWKNFLGYPAETTMFFSSKTTKDVKISKYVTYMWDFWSSKTKPDNCARERKDPRSLLRYTIVSQEWNLKKLFRALARSLLSHLIQLRTNDDFCEAKK